jgi:hypothetical protein
MDYGKIIKRAWHILWRYPALWLFGFFLALAGGSSGGGGGGGGSSAQFNPSDTQNGFDFLGDTAFGRQAEQLLQQANHFFDTTAPGTIIAYVIGIVAILFLIGIVFAVLYYVCYTAAVRMVDRYEESGEKVRVRQGFRWGWSRSAFRLWLIDLVVTIPVVLGILVMFGCAALPILLGIAAGENIAAAGVVAGIILFFLVLFITIIVGLIIRVWLQYAHLVTILQQKGVFASLREGWQILRSYWKDTLLVWLITVGLQIAISIVLIPVIVVILGFSVVISGGLGFLIYSASATLSIPMIVGIVFLFILLMAIPLSFVNGLSEIYFLNVWTLVYRETQVKQILKEVDSSILPQN